VLSAIGFLSLSSAVRLVDEKMMSLTNLQSAAKIIIMKTLDVWKSRLTAVPSTIECPKMRLLRGRDHEPPTFAGSGHIDIKSPRAIDFTIFAEAVDGSDAFRKLVRAHENPYEILDQFRLFATDYEGNEWACGWTRPKPKGTPRIGFPLTGSLESLVTQASGALVSTESSVELVFQPKIMLPTDKSMLSISLIDEVEIQRTWAPGEHSVRVLDSEIKFFYPPSDDSLWVTAKTSDKLPHPYAENWIGEPLRVLLGQLVYPRLVARNFGNGTAQVWLKSSPGHFSNSAIASLVEGNPWKAGSEFWDLYGKLLTMIAEARDGQGHPNFEPHEITRYYHELIQATQGSRWVLCMTLAGAAEGLARMLMPPDERKSDFGENDLESLKRTIQTWEGSEQLRSRVLSWFGFLQEKSVGSYLGTLVKRGVLKAESERAWKAVRNAVMHGELVSPWGTEKEDERLRSLAELVHSLTRELIREKSDATFSS
jgi:hypothetical protein